MQVLLAGIYNCIYEATTTHSVLSINVARVLRRFAIKLLAGIDETLD